MDENNGNTLFAYAIAKEMNYVSPAFSKLYHEEIVTIGYQRVNFHMIFDVKMEDFRRKARLVAGRYVTEPSSTITYASVFSRETVRIALKLVSLNDFPVKVADIQNSYRKAPVIDKILTVLGCEFSEYAASNSIVVCALYGLKISGAAFLESPSVLYAPFGIYTMSC